MTYPIFKRAKILATLGPVTNTPEAIKTLIESGVNGFRLNFSHGSYEERDAQISWIREASRNAHRQVAILQDLQGPKIRLGNLIDNNFPVAPGDEIELVYGIEHEGNRLPVQYNLAEKMQVGEPIFLFDGKIHGEVIAVANPSITIRIKNSGTLMSRKGINLPDTDFGGDVITQKDIEDLSYGATHDIDYVAMSFVQTADDIHQLRGLLNARNSDAKIIAKVETKAAITEENLENIIIASDGVMVARGDLAVEAGAEVVPIVQRDIIRLCQKHGKLSIVATQMMASMVDSPDPTRAEVSDVANAVIAGADVVMLSDETANGSYPIETVQAMRKVILYVQDRVLAVDKTDEKRQDKDSAISLAAVTLGQKLRASAIIAETKSGATAWNIASHRPSLPILSVTSDPRVAQQLALLYANRSFLAEDGDRAGVELMNRMKEDGFFGENPVTVVLVSGRQPGLSGGTDTIRVRII